MAENPEGRSQSRVVGLSELAGRDQSTIYVYTAEQWGTEQAENCLDFLDALMRKLAEKPDAASFVSKRENIRVYVARWNTARDGHRIFFRETEVGIFVLRILHTAMSWTDYLTGREN